MSLSRLRFAPAVALVLGFAVCGWAQPGLPPLDPDDFALMPWGTTGGAQEVFDGVRDCGFNMAGFVSPDDLDRSHKAGLRAIVRDGSVRLRDGDWKSTEEKVTSPIRQLVRRTAGHPAAWGYYLRDEPLATLFPALAWAAAAVRAESPGKRPYINLYPLYVAPSALPSAAPTYEGYIEEYVRIVRPDFISYDHYALMDDGTLRDGYFQNLEVVRAAALRHNLPFWNIALSNAHFRFADPSPATLRFQAYTTLAYGGRGLSWFTYFAPAIGNYRLAPVDQFGHRTATWEAMRQVNFQVRLLAPAYVRLKSVNVFHHPDVPTSCTGIASSRHLAGLTGSGRFVVGEFDGPAGEPYALVVNKDLHTSADFDVRFRRPGSIRFVNAYSGNEQPLEGENGWLAPGQGILLRLQPQVP